MTQANVKVGVTKEVAEAIEVLRSSVGGHNLNEYGIVTYLGDKAQRRVYPELNVLYSYYLGVDAEGFPLDLMNALVNGYDIAKTPEDKVLEYYDGLVETATDGRNDAETRELARYEASGVRQTLDFLGTKVSGVNA